MAENKKLNLEDVEAVETAIAAEISRNDDIVEYIQPSNLELLKARYAAAEEDESIRNEGFEPIKKGGLAKKPRPENTAYGYFSAPVAPKDEIRTDVDSHLSQVFDSTRSEFDADVASFSDISIEIPEVPSTEHSTAPLTVEFETPETVQNFSTTNNRYGFNTHTRVIYFDESAEDGIKRNSDEELSSAFSDEHNSKKRRFGSWTRKRK